MNKNTKKIFLIAFSFWLLAFSITACTSVDRSTVDREINNSGATQKIKVFFTKSKKPEELQLVPVTRKISEEDSIVEASIRELFLGPTKAEQLKGIMSEIPVGTRLINVDESDEEVLVNISSQYLTGGGSATIQLRYLQIYNTLKKIEPFKEIYLQVDGKMLKAIGGEGLEVSQPLTKINDYTKKYEKTEDVQP